MNYITKDSTEYLEKRFDNFYDYLSTRPTGKPKMELKDLVKEAKEKEKRGKVK